MDREIQGEGTSEGEWAECSELGGVPWSKVDKLIPEGVRVVVMAPHPDDEILPCGGLLASMGEREVVVVAVTDGEASHPEISGHLRMERPVETRVALSRLGIDAEIRRLGFADGELLPWESLLVAAIGDELRDGDVVLTPWGFDGHPDHEATTRAVREAAASFEDVRVIEMPIWGWHWSRPGEGSMPWDRAVRVPIEDEILLRKRSAILAFESQVVGRCGDLPILTERTLERFYRRWEVFFL
ncbi:MAG: PIG-L family deacetylase [Chthoniobacterales bacterium]